MIGLKEILTKSLQSYFVALAFLEKYFCKHLAILAFSDFRIFRTKWPPESETDTSSSIIKGKAEQGRSQELEMGGAKLLGEGSWGHLRPPVGAGQSPGRGARGANPPGSSRVLNI